MSSSPITADQLRALRDQRKVADLRSTVELITKEYVIPAAQAGKKSVLIGEGKYTRGHVSYGILFPPSLPELIAALRVKFPDIHVDEVTQTTILRNGLFDKTSYVLIDWSVAPEPPANV